MENTHAVTGSVVVIGVKTLISEYVTRCTTIIHFKIKKTAGLRQKQSFTKKQAKKALKKQKPFRLRKGFLIVVKGING